MTARLLVGTLLLAAGCAGATGPEPMREVAGRWTGQCERCPVRAFHLVLVQDGDRLTGTLRPQGRSGLGEGERPILDGKLVGRRVTFRTDAEDGVPFRAELQVSHDGQFLAGQGRHRADFPLTFTRAGR